MNNIITQLKDKQNFYGIVSIEKHERFRGTADSCTIYFYNKDIPIIGGQYIKLEYSIFSQNGSIYLYEITAVDLDTKQFDYSIVAYNEFKNKRLFQVEKFFQQIIAIRKAKGIKRKILNGWYLNRKFNAMMLLIYILIIIL